MEIAKVIALAVVCAILCYHLKSINSELFLPAVLASGIILLSYAIQYLGYAFNSFNELFSKFSFESSLIKQVIKIILIAYLIEFSAGLIEDLGLKGMADKLVFAGKILLLCLSLPIFEFLLDTVSNFLG